jgi:hypothetical protein
MCSKEFIVLTENIPVVHPTGQKMCSSFPWQNGIFNLLEHIFQKWAVRLTVRYFSAGIAPRELKFCTLVRLCVRLNRTIRNLGSVALGQSSSVISLKINTFLKRQLYHLVKYLKMPWQHAISYLFQLC